MRVEIKTACPAYVYETWEVDLPEGLPADEVRDAAWKALCAGGANLIEDEHDDERDRELVGINVI